MYCLSPFFFILFFFFCLSLLWIYYTPVLVRADYSCFGLFLTRYGLMNGPWAKSP
jgi:hypothetical protein